MLSQKVANSISTLKLDCADSIQALTLLYHGQVFYHQL